MRGKSKFSAKKREKIVREWRSSKMRPSVIARKYGITINQLHAWERTILERAAKETVSHSSTMVSKGMRHVIMPPFEGPTHQFVIADELDEISKTLNLIQGDIVILKGAQEILARYKRSTTNGSKG